MKDYIKHDEWCIIEENFYPHYNEITESLMSIGNGRMGGRANFEEKYSGKSLQGNYVAGVWFPDKTRVGWWKNGYPRYFAKVINACNWVGIDIKIDDEILDLTTSQIADFKRVLDMQKGVLQRQFIATLPSGKQVFVSAERFCSIVDDEAAAISYSITPLNFDGKIILTPYLDGDVSNKDANYGEKFWEEVKKETAFAEAYLQLRTKQNPFDTQRFDVCSGMKIDLQYNRESVDFQSYPVKLDKYVGCQVEINAKANDSITLHKYVANLASLNHSIEALLPHAKDYIKRIADKGYDQMRQQQADAWAARWAQNDIIIDGDIAAQQGIRFNIFQLQQTYTGEDARLNIGPKGFTGEKYGGSTYWDTEAYCIPFYLATADQHVARNLLIYRHNQLQKAIENGEKLGFKNGAALYPMVTMTGEECHNEWEITFEEIHRNGAIAYAIYDYVRYTGDTAYIPQYGLDVLIGIARFWAQRVNWSGDKQKYVMLGVTGPNEYENNVNNNWYTNYIATWCLQYTIECINKYASNKEALQAEITHWQHIIDNIHLPYDAARQVFLQQDGFLDKELLTVNDITEHRPINQKWSWDRILRSCFIKQADVLQGLYFFEDNFDTATIKRNFDFYEPMTVHESSLSPCVHVILAAKLGYNDKAYEMYLRTSRLDLDDYNNDTEDGLHITSMAGTWMAVIKGFAGMRIKDDKLSFSPFLPTQWQGYSFRIGFRGQTIKVKVTQSEIEVENLSEHEISVYLQEQLITLLHHTSYITQ